MGFKKMIGLDMQLPAGKLPGYYAQIVKGIAERAPLTDRYKELLIFESENDLPAVIELLDRYKVAAERCELLWLPNDGVAPGELYEDYAIVTRNDNIYVDLALTALFALDAAKPDAEPAPALLQLEEHLIGEITYEEQTIYMMDRQLTLLADRIAIAYKCEINWLDFKRLL